MHMFRKPLPRHNYHHTPALSLPTVQCEAHTLETAGMILGACFKCRSIKDSKLRVPGIFELCWGNIWNLVEAGE